jgi:hypothetical protein
MLSRSRRDSGWGLGWRCGRGLAGEGVKDESLAGSSDEHPQSEVEV